MADNIGDRAFEKCEASFIVSKDSFAEAYLKSQLIKYNNKESVDWLNN